MPTRKKTLRDYVVKVPLPPRRPTVDVMACPTVLARPNDLSAAARRALGGQGGAPPDGSKSRPPGS